MTGKIDEKNVIQWVKRQFLPHCSSYRNRETYLDVAKILAAVLVVFYHFAFYRLDYGFVPGSPYVPNLERILMSTGACSVPLFFTVNGILMFSRHRTVESVYVKALKIGILLLFWSLFQFPAWFFKTMIGIYIVFPVLQLMKEKHRKVYVLIEIGIFLFPFLFNFALMIAKFARVETIMYIPISYLHVTGAFTGYSVLYFMLGAQLPGMNVKKWKAALLMGVGLFLTLFECKIYTDLNQQIYDGVNSAFPTVGALFLTIGVVLYLKSIKLYKIPRFWQQVGGTAVLPIYLIHMKVSRTITFLAGGEIESLSLLYAVAGTILICVVCGLIGYIMKKIPVCCFLVNI